MPVLEFDQILTLPGVSDKKVARATAQVINPGLTDREDRLRCKCLPNLYGPTTIEVWRKQVGFSQKPFLTVTREVTNIGRDPFGDPVFAETDSYRISGASPSQIEEAARLLVEQRDRSLSYRLKQAVCQLTTHLFHPPLHWD